MTADDAAPETGPLTIARPSGGAGLAERVLRPVLIVLDIDGTVLLEDESYSPGVIDAVQDARDAGHEVMVATGRGWAGTQGILEDLGIAPEYAVCSNGAVVLRRAADREFAYERVHTETFDPSEVLELLRSHLPDAQYMVEHADGERLYTDFIEDWNLSQARRVSFAELSSQPVSRVVVVAPDHDGDDFARTIERLGLNQVSYAIGWSAWLDIAPKGVDKGTALELVRGWLGIPREQVLVIGDGRNDAGMFRWAREGGGRAVAMAQAPQEVKDLAGEVTASVADGGVAAVLRALPGR